MDPISIKRRGDLKAIEGTQVTLHAAANQPIRSASVDFNCDGKADRGLKVNGQNATITFALSMNHDRTGPLFDSYQLLFINDQGVENPEPVKQRIEVVPDLPPEVAFLVPRRKKLPCRSMGKQRLRCERPIPIFALSSVVLHLISGGAELLVAASSEQLKESPHAGPFVARYEFVPATLGLKAGDVVRYQAVAFDNKTPDANETDTPERRIRIVAPQPVNPRHQANPAQPNDQKNAGGNPPKNQKQPDAKNQTGGAKQGNGQGDKNQPPGKDQKANNNQSRTGGQANNQGDANQKPIEDQQAGGGQGQGQNPSQDSGNQSENQSGDNNGGSSKNSGNNSSGKSSKSSGGKSNSNSSNSQQNSNSATSDSGNDNSQDQQNQSPAGGQSGNQQSGGQNSSKLRGNQSGKQQSAGQGQFAVGRFIARERRLAAK